MRLIQMLEGTNGRLARIVLGAILVGIGATLGGGWWVLAVVGLIPIAAGLFDFCLLAPFFGDKIYHSHRHA
jgi:hypothetical protein